VVDASNRRVLLVHHAKLGLWVQPGGHVEPQDERVAHAALREAREETGVADLALGSGVLHVDRHPAPCLPPGSGVHLDLLHLVVAPDDAVPVVSTESTDVRWFDVDALPDDVVPGLADRLRERPPGTWRERNDARHRRVVGLRHDLPWVREVLRRHDDGDRGTVVAGGMRKIVLTREEAASRPDLP
jgi:8-oxo-dGTP pyrophosphatase MutT (NUDIX family)